MRRRWMNIVESSSGETLIIEKSLTRIQKISFYNLLLTPPGNRRASLLVVSLDIFFVLFVGFSAVDLAIAIVEIK